MKYSRFIQKLSLILLSILSFTACNLIRPIAQEGPHKEAQGVGLPQEGQGLGPTEETRLSQEISYKEARENYIARFGEPQISFTTDKDGALFVSIITKNLILSSVNMEEVDAYYNYIYSSPQVMEKYATGKIKDKAFASLRIDTWVNRWRSHNPFAGLTVRCKKELSEDSFLGNVVLGDSEESNSAEIAYFLRKDKWNQGFGTESVGAIILFYAQELIKLNYKKLPNNQDFTRIMATCRTDNHASNKILEKTAMKVYTTDIKYGHQRNYYECTITK